MFLTIAGDDENSTGLYLGDRGRLQAGEASVLGKFLKPGIAGRVGQIGFRPPIAMALVVLDQPAVQRIIGRDLALAGNRGVDPEAIRIGGAAEAADHFCACHLGDIGGVELRRCSVVPSGLRFGQGLPIA